MVRIECFQACKQIGVVFTAMMDVYGNPLGAKPEKTSCLQRSLCVSKVIGEQELLNPRQLFAINHKFS